MNGYKWLKITLTLLFPILLILGWTECVAPELKKLPEDFAYSANILSLDNFYDENAKKFLGQQISKSHFRYYVESVNPSYLSIANIFNVKTLNGQTIFSVSHTYFINPYTGKHVAVANEEDRYGYLFAPRYASNKPFYYWHINYDAPALMRYVNTEKIHGLTVNHYESHYAADQTANLTNLPGVPQKRGVRTDIELQLWIEPISGWLIKYQDNTFAYYYDRATGSKLFPWNNFSNRYTENSILEKVNEATWLKWKILFIDFGVPCIIILLTAFIAFYHEIKKVLHQLLATARHIFLHTQRLVFFRITVGIFLVAIGCSAYYLIWYKAPPSIYNVGILQWDNNIELIAAIQGFKDGLRENGFIEGKNIQYRIKNPNSSVLKAVDIIQGFLKNNVDIIYTLTTPGVLVAKGSTTKVPIVFTDVSYPTESGIINPTACAENHLVGTSNYILPAEQFYYFDIAFPNTKTLGFVHHKGDPDSEMQYQEYKKTLARRQIAVVDISAIDFDDMKKQLNSILKQSHYNALFIACDTLMRDGGGTIAAQFALANKIPTLTCDKESINHGAMIGYFADLYSLGKKAGIKAALILRGAEPGWLHTDSSSKGSLMINTPTATLLGISIPSDELEKLNTDQDH